MDEKQKQHILDLPKVAAGAVASPLAALLTSRFGIAGTMIGLALSAVIITVVVDTLKVYLARVPEAVTSIPGGFKTKSPWRKFLIRSRLAFSKLSSIPPARRRSLVLGSVVAGVISFVVGLVIVTGVEASVGKNLSCWVWNDCVTESSADGGDASDVSTLPSILGGSRRVSSAPQVGPSAPQQPTPHPTAPPATPAPPTPSASSSGNRSQPSVSEEPSAPPSRQQSPTDEYQQRIEYQQQSEHSEHEQQDGYHQQSLSSSSSETQQQSPSGELEDQQPKGAQNENPSSKQPG